jgi:hypothetical protein
MTRINASDAQGAKTGTSPAGSPALNPGDEAPPGTTGTGEDVCPDCHGKGRIDGAPCATCGGSGTVVPTGGMIAGHLSCRPDVRGSARLAGANPLSELP